MHLSNTSKPAIKVLCLCCKFAITGRCRS